jgi:hypothetical protein
MASGKLLPVLARTWALASESCLARQVFSVGSCFVVGQDLAALHEMIASMLSNEHQDGLQWRSGEVADDPAYSCAEALPLLG